MGSLTPSADVDAAPVAAQFEGGARRTEPTFIIGDHRSGTTLLYQMLAATGAFTFVSAYHVIRRDQLAGDVARGEVRQMRAAVDDLLRRQGLVDRVIDGVKVSASLPEEYGFVIDDGPRPQLRAATLPRFWEFCRLVQASGEGRPLLLKNPWDSMQFMTLKAVVPDARFIFLHREPTAIVSSQLRAIRSMLAARNDYAALIAPWYARLFQSPVRLAACRGLFSARLGLGVRIVERHVARVCSYFVRRSGAVPADAALNVRYEDLCADPTGTIASVLSFVGAPTEAAGAMGSLIDRRVASLLPEVEWRRAAFNRRVGPYRARVGYAA
jgi:hypothetical protein